jgi:hypothetical protein
MASTALAAAEKLQIALGQTSYTDDFASFVPPNIVQQIVLHMKTMKNLWVDIQKSIQKPT